MTAFKFDAKTVFLTYAQCDLAINELYNALLAVTPIKWARICREQHQDGNYHLHAVIKFTKRFQSRRAEVFDVKRGDESFHPNIGRVQSEANSLEYVAKDGEFSDFGPVPSGESHSIEELVELAGTAEDTDYWKACCKARIPFQYAQRFRELANKASDTVTEYNGSIERERIDLAITPLPEEKTIVLVGPTGIGKTSWAKRNAPKPALWVRHLDMLRTFKSGYHKSIIFDDMDFKHLPRVTQLYIADFDDDQQIHVRYGVARIPAGTVKIFTANEYPFMIDPAIDRRIHFMNFV